jgi:PTS system mannose-specific IIA component
MQGMLVVTHGRLAEELVDSARTIVGGRVEALEAVSIDWNDDVEEATERIRRAAKRVDRGGGVLVLTDMFGGTPTNLALSMLEPGKLEIVTGVNLAMLIKFANLRQEADLTAAAADIANHGRDSIQIASPMLQGGDDPAAEAKS